MAQLRAPVEAPPARPPRTGLLTAAPVVTDDDLHVIGGGWKYQPEGCGLSGIDSIDCEGDVGVMAMATGPDIIEGRPLWIWAGDECSTFGYQARDWEARARRQLAANESFELARELWEGGITTADSLDNRYLAMPGASSDTVTDGPTAVVSALACVEQALAEALRGQQGMVHTTPAVLVHLAAFEAVHRDGQVWATPMGHIVVADAGYTGAGPGGAAADVDGQWIYGTPMIQVRLGPPELIPGTLAEAKALAEALDRGLNDITVLAGRLAGYQWANECAHIAAQVNVPVCLIGGAS